jgi:hypothetical protein
LNERQQQFFWDTARQTAAVILYLNQNSASSDVPMCQCDLRHSGIALMAPDTVHYGRSTALTVRRGVTLDAAFIAHPARFKGVAPRPPSVPLTAWINPPKKETTPPTITPNCSLNS